MCVQLAIIVNVIIPYMFDESPINLTGKMISKKQEFQSLSDEAAIAKMTNEYNKVLLNFSDKVRIDPETQEEKESKRAEKERSINTVYLTLVRELSGKRSLDLNDRKKAILKAKIARHYQFSDHVDHSGIIDAIVESPKFLEREEGGITKLMETHQMKTAQKRAEIIKRKMEMQRPEAGSAIANPYEALFTTVSGNYYLARLLNIPHLEDESVYMEHCIGNSDSYINKMIRGDVEIFSLRKLGDIDPVTGKQGEDKPVMTWEFEPKTGIMQQMKMADDNHLIPTDEFYPDVIDALKRLKYTTYHYNNKDIPRRIRKIEPWETRNFLVKDGYILTDKREVKLADFELQTDEFLINIGKYWITENMPINDVAKLLKLVEDIDCTPDQIARSVDEISATTKVYIGELFKDFFKVIPDHIEHIYINDHDYNLTTHFEGKVYRYHFDLKPITAAKYKEELDEAKVRISSILIKNLPTLTNPESVDIIRFRIRDFIHSSPYVLALYNKVAKLGLEICPPQIGPEYSLRYTNQLRDEYNYIGMEPIDVDGEPHVFRVGCDGGDLYLTDGLAGEMDKWDSGCHVLFRVRK